ncbi:MULTISPECIES: hypothetical protein [Arthrobacter]|uniref:WXG100 family type VII secretion target n=2 Tax=Arthrobacter TaxID=1663 RepID=A0ABU9KMK0_9MICC|nr:hypothetical protein [Arthrobacter sp. YJM1]MDP5228432.1 hypothetical protein [Arthrobacter sp. YJM1]
MGIWGADVNQLRTLGKKLQHGADVLNDQRTQLAATLNGTQWMGPDADSFRNEWDSVHFPALVNAAHALSEAGTRAAQNANEQEIASR